MTASKTIDRRTAVKLAAAATVLVAGSPYIVTAGKAFADGEEGVTPDAAPVEGQVGFLVKPKNCLNCQACVDACRKFNKIDKDQPARRKVTKYEKEGEAPLFVSTSCMHCANPACATVCPAGAIVKGEAGIVSVDDQRCIGCKYCYQACPFGVPHYTSVSMDKCDCCLGNGVKPGEEPHCAEACNFGALHFGMVADLLAECPEATVVESSTQPSFYLA